MPTCLRVKLLSTAHTRPVAQQSKRGHTYSISCKVSREGFGACSAVASLASPCVNAITYERCRWAARSGNRGTSAIIQQEGARRRRAHQGSGAQPRSPSALQAVAHGKG